VIESACVRFATEVLEASGVEVPDHLANVVALYASLAPELRDRIHSNMQALFEQFGTREAARRLGVDRGTLCKWGRRPDQMPLYRVLPALVYNGRAGLAPGRTKGTEVASVGFSPPNAQTSNELVA
jgi:hypothetical protein